MGIDMAKFSFFEPKFNSEHNELLTKFINKFTQDGQQSAQGTQTEADQPKSYNEQYRVKLNQCREIIEKAKSDQADRSDDAELLKKQYYAIHTHMNSGTQLINALLYLIQYATIIIPVAAYFLDRQLIHLMTGPEEQLADLIKQDQNSFSSTSSS